MHSSHHTKFQPERWLPDPVRARFDVFWLILASLYSLFKQPTQLLWLLNSHNMLLWHSNSPCVAASQPLCGFHTDHVHGTGTGRDGHGTGGARKVWRHCRPLPTHTHPRSLPRAAGGKQQILHDGHF